MGTYNLLKVLTLWKQGGYMACFERASPGLKEILLKLYRAKKPLEFDHHIYELGSVEYHIQSSASDPHHAYLSISTPLLSQENQPPHGLPAYTIQLLKEACSNVVEIVEPAREGHHLTLTVNFSKFPRGKDPAKIITQISAVQAIILSSQLKEMLRKIGSKEASHGMYKPIKLMYHPREPFFVIRQISAAKKFHEKPISTPGLSNVYPSDLEPDKITAAFPMRFREDSDVILATAFFRELMDVGSLQALAKAPPCTWSPIPPPELRGEPLEDLSTNGGFVSFEIFSRHVEGKRLDKTVWSLLNFYALVKYHIKSTRGFIQRRMRTRLGSLVQLLHTTSEEEDEDDDKTKGYRCIKKFASFAKSKSIKLGCRNFTKKITRIHCPIKVHAFSRFRRRWLTIPKGSSAMKYSKLD